MKIFKNGKIHSIIGAVGGMLIGISQNSYGLGIALALALGTAIYIKQEK
ncbi:MAG: hypothetical protein ACI88L_000732 [Candidatus Paceibacteria bacterium]|jgi:hypothetical protein